MRFAVDFPQFGPYADPRLLAELAREAEDSGWDGFFIWDHVQVGWPDPVADPWIALAAIASATKRIRLGALVTPIFRRTPWHFARETVTLDHLSQGRLVVGVGIATDIFKELSTFAYPLDDKVRAEMLDEGLAILTGLWSGQPFTFEGKHYRVGETTFLPKPVQTPRIPIWVAGTWPLKPPYRRAARFDGVVPISTDIEKPLTPDDVRAIIKFIKQQRTSNAPFDVVIAGFTGGVDSANDRAQVSPYADAGATWWNESILPWKRPLDEARKRIRSGPPRL
jgi:alkanesulfonate monooxygenase SsuD/methylene tetrahydromethanopterin reductase-like flavin-dependent oxidoreductase (luciferase family)